MEVLKQVGDVLCALVPESMLIRTILIGTAAGLAVYLATRKKYKWPPGPSGSPLIGSLLTLEDGPFYTKMMELEKEYGPVMSLKIGLERYVILNSFDVIQEALVDKSVDFAGRNNSYSENIYTSGGKDIAFTDYGPTWQMQRRLALKALKNYLKGNFLQDTLDELLSDFVEDIKKIDGAFDMHDHIKLLVFNILSKVCFNEKFSADNEEYIMFMKNLGAFEKNEGKLLEDYIPPLRLFPTQKFKDFMKMLDEMKSFYDPRVSQHRSTFNAAHIRDFTDALLLAQEEAKAEENPDVLATFTDEHLAHTVMDIFEAGIDTSRLTLYWTILYMAVLPDIQTKVQEELDRVMGDRRIPRVTDREHLPYTRAVLHESMRMSSVAPISLPHSTTRDTTIRGYDVPKDTTVLVNLYAVHHDPKIWDDPEVFKPERFLEDSGKMKIKVAPWMPFSVGKRACLAESLAKPELLLILAGIMKNFRVKPPDGVIPDVKPQYKISFTCVPTPYEVKTELRE